MRTTFNLKINEHILNKYNTTGTRKLWTRDRIACLHAFKQLLLHWLPSSLLFPTNTVIGCQLLQRHDAGTPYTEWIGKDHTGVGLRKILTSWSLQNINALTFTFRTRGFPKISLTWKVSKMMHLLRCILILLAGKKYVLLFVDFPALFSSLGYTSFYTRRRFSAECCVQLVEFLNFCPILIVILSLIKH